MEKIKSKEILLLVRLTVRQETDVQEIVNEMDYSFTYENAILETEIMDIMPQ